MNVLTIIGGLNGAGKSSLTGVLKAERSDLGVIINVDEIAKVKHISNLEAGKIALNKIGECLKAGVNVSWETTLSGRITLRIIKKAKSLNYFIRLFYVGISSYEELLNRIHNSKIFRLNYLRRDGFLTRCTNLFPNKSVIIAFVKRNAA